MQPWSCWWPSLPQARTCQNRSQHRGELTFDAGKDEVMAPWTEYPDLPPELSVISLPFFLESVSVSRILAAPIQRLWMKAQDVAGLLCCDPPTSLCLILYPPVNVVTERTCHPLTHCLFTEHILWQLPCGVVGHKDE